MRVLKAESIDLLKNCQSNMVLCKGIF